MLMAFMTSNASAMFSGYNWNENTKTAEVTDWIGLDKVMDIQLISNTEYCISHCEAVLKITPDNNIDINSFEDFGFLIKDLSKTVDMSDKIISLKTYIKNGTETYISREKTGENCEILEQENGTYQSCIPIYSDIEQIRDVWQEFDLNPSTFKSISSGGEPVYIKLVGEKEPQASVDWIPIVYGGIEIKEMAVWTAGMNIGLVYYYNMTTGLEQVSGVYNLTALEGTPIYNSENTLIGNNINFTTNNNVQIVDDPSGLFDFRNATTPALTWNFWVNIPFRVSAAPGMGGFEKYAGGGAGYYIEIGRSDTNIISPSYFCASGDIGVPSLPLGAWNMITIIVNTSSSAVYVNGVYNVSCPKSTANGINSNTARVLSIARGDQYGWLDARFQMDEWGIWNRSLTLAEIADLATGMTYTDIFSNETLTIVASMPANSFNTSASSITFGCNATTTGTTNINSIVLNVTNNINWSQKVDGLSVKSYNATFLNDTLDDGDYSWHCDGYGDTANGTSAVRTFTKDTISPSLAVSTPVANASTMALPYNVSMTVVSSDSHLDSCWYNTNENPANISYACNALQYIEFSIGGQYIITDYANDTFGNENSTTISFFINNIDASAMSVAASIVEGENNTVYFNATSTSIYQANASVNYNGSLYLMALISNNGTDAVFSRVLSAPLVGEDTIMGVNISFFINGDEWNTSTQNQLVYNIPQLNITSGICSGNQSYLFDLKNEDLLIPASMIGDWLYNINYGLSNSSLVNTAGNIISTTNISICINDTVSPSFTMGTGNIIYSAPSAIPRIYLFAGGTNLTTTPVNVTLYLSNMTIDLVAKILDSNLVPQKNITVNLLRYYPSTSAWLNIESDISDELGQTIFHVIEKTVNYRFILSSGSTILYTTDTVKVVCYATPCSIELTIPSTSGDLFKYYTSRSGVSSSLTYDNDSEIVSLIYASLDGTPKTMQLLVKHINMTDQPAVCSNYSSGLAGLLTCNLTGYNSNFFAQSYVNTTAGIMNIIDRISISTANFFKTTGKEGLLYSMLFIITLVMVGIWNPAVSIGLATVGFILLGITGIISMGWAVLTSIVILGGIIIWNLKT